MTFFTRHAGLSGNVGMFQKSLSEMTPKEQVEHHLGHLLDGLNMRHYLESWMRGQDDFIDRRLSQGIPPLEIATLIHVANAPVLVKTEHHPGAL